MSHSTPDEILRLGMGFWGSKALLSAVELRVFTAFAPISCRLGYAPSEARSS